MKPSGKAAAVAAERLGSAGAGATASPSPSPRRRPRPSDGRRTANPATAGGGSAAPVIAAAAVCSMVAGALAQTFSSTEFIPRAFDGVGNNDANPEWGAVGTTMLRSVAGADYADADFTPPGATRPTAREVMTDVFLPSPPAQSTASALFIAWGQLLTFDLALIESNFTEPFDIPCNDADGAAGGGVSTDVWCPEGASSDPIPFFRSKAALSDDGGALSAATRSPTNQATAFVDLDFIYGRSEEEAQTYRALDGTGFMTLTDAGLPPRSDDGTTWLIPDQRTARFPVTFALHVVLLREHNRCCVEVAPALGYEGDEDLYQACRGWTIAVFQHVTENDFSIRLLGGNVMDIGLADDASATLPPVGTGAAASAAASTPATGEGNDSGVLRRNRDRRRRLQNEFETRADDDYVATTNPGADVFALTVVAAALESALPSTVRVVGEGYGSTAYDNIELAVAVGGDSLATFFENVEVADVLRGAALSPVFALDTSFTAAISNTSPLFKLPVDAVQRGRDHGLPTYNDARVAYGLTEAANFVEVVTPTEDSTATPTEDSTAVAALLAAAYGGDVASLDAVTGALAESTQAGTGGFFGPLLHAAWLEQMYRTITGDRFHHRHSIEIEDASMSTISELLNRTVGAADIPLSAFSAASVAVCDADCVAAGVSDAALSDSFSLAWEMQDDDMLLLTLSAKGIGEQGMLGIGFGGLTMSTAQDFVICEVLSTEEAECIDRRGSGARALPQPDTTGDPNLGFLSVTIEGGWTTVSFLKPAVPLGDEDYDLASDFAAGTATEVIFSFREGAGVGQHPNANRGASMINFVTGDVAVECDANNFATLHGALMLLAWMVLAPWGIYFVRYRKGEQINLIWTYEWWEMHEEIMIVASEAVLPLAITAIFASGGNHVSSHAHWGYYMIVAVTLQILSGWLRVQGLEGKNPNFSMFHRFNKFFHIYSGRVAYLAGVVQCYRGLELVASDDALVFSAGEGLDLQIGSFGFVYRYAFPAWFGVIAITFLFFETRKQYRRFFKKGSAQLLGCVQIVNQQHGDGANDDGADGGKERLVPRTENLPLYSVAEFNDKVLNGQSWVLVDGAILDVEEFAQRHPGGRRLILNALGTDITHELLGEDLSVGHAMSFSPHVHTERAWKILRELVMGYIEEDEEDEDSSQSQTLEGVQEEEGGGGQSEENKAAEGSNGGLEKTRKSYDIRIGGRAVLAGNNRTGLLSGDPLAKKAQRLSAIATAADPVHRESKTCWSGHVAPHEMDQPQRVPRAPPKRSNSSSKKLLERFHVCPLLFREKMEATTPVKRGFLPPFRPVYRYIFLCPGQAQVLVKAINGVCYFNMRAQEKGHRVIQRSYNAFAVRVQESSNDVSGGGTVNTPGGGLGTRANAADDGPGTLRVVSANETQEGVLCIEMRIRLYHDGAMSKILDKLAKDPDNPAVQLQGPFLIKKLAPPPAHRNVVMIAAGTGINPMVQQIRDYLALSRADPQCPRSRLALLWQANSQADLYGAEEITAMQAQSNGLLEVTVLISGEHRKTNIPGAAFRKGAGKFMANAKGFISPVLSSPANKMKGVARERRVQGSSPFGLIKEHEQDLFAETGSSPAPTKGSLDGPTGAVGGNEHLGSGLLISAHGSDFGAGSSHSGTGGVFISGRESDFGAAYSSSSVAASVDGDGGMQSVFHVHRRSKYGAATSSEKPASTAVGALTRGKVSREVLEEVFGPNLNSAVRAAFEQSKELNAAAARNRRSKSRVGARGTGGTASPGSSEGKEEDEDEGGAENRREVSKAQKSGRGEDEDDEEDEEASLADQLVGSDTVPGKIQVVVSGPSGFVFHVETILSEMGVPQGSIVMLD